MAGEDIKNRVAGLPLELSEKKDLIKKSLDNFKKVKSFSPAAFTEKPQTPLARPANIGQKTPTQTGAVNVNTVPPTLSSPLKGTVDLPSSLSAGPAIGDLSTLSSPPEETGTLPVIGDSPSPKKEKPKEKKKQVDAITFASNKIIDYIKGLFPDNKELQNDLLEETFKYYDKGIGVKNPTYQSDATAQDLGRFKKGGLMKRKY